MFVTHELIAQKKIFGIGLLLVFLFQCAANGRMQEKQKEGGYPASQKAACAEYQQELPAMGFNARDGDDERDDRDGNLDTGTDGAYLLLHFVVFLVGMGSGAGLTYYAVDKTFREI